MNTRAATNSAKRIEQHEIDLHNTRIRGFVLGGLIMGIIGVSLGYAMAWSWACPVIP